jgi:hypothetical protein
VLRRFDEGRKDKHVSNDDWTNPNDPDSRIARMKDGVTTPDVTACASGG